MRYRGSGNQLYRVEIHRPGRVNGNNGPTFKWSRENGSVVFPIESPVTGSTVILKHLGRDERFGLKEGDWVEIVDDSYVLQNRAEPLLQVDKIARDERKVILSAAPTVGENLTHHPLLRRWDHQGHPTYDGALLVEEGVGDKDEDWIPLEDGVRILFPEPRQGEPAHEYRPGDFWLIPARSATGDVEWPRDHKGNPTESPPHGIAHHYAPLWLVSVTKGGVTAEAKDDLRRRFEAGAK
jgi:hypothetical protein